MAETLKDVPRDQVLNTVVSRVQKFSRVNGFFQEMRVTPEAQYKFDEHAANWKAGRANTAMPSYEHLEQGFWGTHARELLDQTSLDQEDLLRIWGYAKLTVYVAGADARAAKRCKTG